MFTQKKAAVLNPKPEQKQIVNKQRPSSAGKQPVKLIVLKSGDLPPEFHKKVFDIENAIERHGGAQLDEHYS